MLGYICGGYLRVPEVIQGKHDNGSEKPEDVHRTELWARRRGCDDGRFLEKRESPGVGDYSDK